MSAWPAASPGSLSRWGGGGFTTRQSGVLWLDFDNGQRRTHERFGALARAHGVPTRAPLHYVSMPEPRLDAGDTESMRALANRIITRDICLVVIDNLGVVSGDSEENSADMQKPMSGLRWLAETTEAAIIVLHHQRKANGNTKDARSGETLRGHGSIEASIDLGVLISRDGANITLSATKVRGPSIQTFGASFSFDNDPQHELLTARFWPFNPDQEDAEELADLERSVSDYLRKNPGDSATAVYNDVGGNKQHLFDVIRTMERDGKILRRPGSGNSSKLFVTP